MYRQSLYSYFMHPVQGVASVQHCLRRHLATVYGIPGGFATVLSLGNTSSSCSMRRLRSSMMRRKSASLSTTVGEMNSTSSVRLLLSFCEPKSPPRTGRRETSGKPLDEFSLSSVMRPPITSVWPDGTATSVCTERVLIGGARVGSVVVPGVLTSALTSSVTRPPALMCGVTCSNTPVSMYCEVVVTALVVVPTVPPPTNVCWLMGMRLPTLIVAFWLSSADTCGFEITLALP